MKKIAALLLLIFFIYKSFNSLLPSSISDKNQPKTEFSTARALTHLAKIAEAPHYLGSVAHHEVRHYIIKELDALGLKPEVQEGTSISQWGNLAKAKNVIARIAGSGNGDAVVLLTHYDSQQHSSFGASDAGSGVVTILEGVRAFLEQQTQPKNDIILVFTDAEELGLNGADIFVNQHPWANDVKVVLNFEARGSGGPSYMLIETNGGNKNLIQAFQDANVQYPVANSLAYSIYKMLPNDTDLTRFREDKNIDGFNFAFIDDHYDYHTALDTYERLDQKTLEHQGSYLMPLLKHFSHSNLSGLKAETDVVYFNVPYFKLIAYPYSCIFPMLTLSLVFFILILRLGLKKRIFRLQKIIKGFGLFFSALVLTAGIAYLLWQLILKLYPQYGEMLHGFTYNGHLYIAAFVALALALCFFIYNRFTPKQSPVNLLVAPLVFWFLINIVVAFKLKGAAFFILPLWCGLLILWLHIRQKTPNILLLTLIAAPVIFILVPFTQMFPVGLGLKILFGSSVLVVLIFGLLYGVFYHYKSERWHFSSLSTIAFIGLLFYAHFTAEFDKNKPKPNSLVYLLNADTDTAYWLTYDNVLDNWTKAFLTASPKSAAAFSNTAIRSKYASSFSYMNDAPVKEIAKPIIETLKDTLIADKRHITLVVTPQRLAERIEVFSSKENLFFDAKLNGVNAHRINNNQYVFDFNRGQSLFSYFITDNDPLVVELVVPSKQATTLEFYEAAYNLVGNPQFGVPNRTNSMIPKPFVLNDATVIYKTITID